MNQPAQTEVQPDDAEVVQAEDGHGTEMVRVPVVIDGPVRTVNLPAKSGGMFTVSGVDNNGTRLVSHDPRRRQVTIISTADIMIGGNQSQANLKGARIPANVAFVYHGLDELWGASVAVPPATADVSVIVENWAD